MLAEKFSEIAGKSNNNIFNVIRLGSRENLE